MQLTDQKIRELALDVTQSFIVQAPAGSGKTELLTQRYLALLSQVSAPETILAITFTRKAAQEMRRRIIGALEDAKNSHEILDHQQITRQLAIQVLQNDQMHQWQLLENPNRLRIQTIDSLCAQLTRQMPLLAKFGAEAKVAEDPSLLYKKAITHLLKNIDNKKSSNSALEKLLLHLDNNIDKTISLFTLLLQHREQWLSYVITAKNIDNLRDILEASLQNITADCLQTLPSLIPSEEQALLISLLDFAAKNLQENNIESSITNCRHLMNLPEANLENKNKWLGIAEMLLTETKTWRKQITKNIGFPAPSNTTNSEEKNIFKFYKTQFQNLLEKFSQYESLRIQLAELTDCPPLRYTEEQWSIIESLLVVLPILVAELKLVFLESGKVDFTEIALQALEALGNPEQPTDLALRFEHQIQHILVDEFQDTSLLQFQLLEKLTVGWQQKDSHTLFLVGDPMQSIYRFRQAEVGLFIKVQQEGIHHLKLKSLTLSSNFRSDAGIVDWINQSFRHIFPRRADIFTGAIPHSDAEATHLANEKNAVVIRACHSDQEEADHIIHVIRTVLNEQPTFNIAILVRARSHLQKLIPALRQAELAFQAVELEQLSQRSIIHDLWTLTCALLHLGDRLAWLAFLRAPWCGLTLSDLQHIAEISQNKTIWEVIENPLQLQILSEDGQNRINYIVKLLKKSFSERHQYSLRQWLESTWHTLKGLDCVVAQNTLTDAKTFWQLIEKYDHGGDIFDFNEIEIQLTKLYAQIPEHTSKKIQLMTIHKAKGLEFDVVILPGLSETTPPNISSLLLWSERPRSLQASDLILAPIKAMNEESDPIYHYLRQIEQKREAYETSRLLYVAVTRAKKNLYLLCQTKQHEEGKLIKPSAGSLIAPLWPQIQDHLQQEFSSQENHLENNEISTREHFLYRLPSAVFISENKDLLSFRAERGISENTKEIPRRADSAPRDDRRYAKDLSRDTQNDSKKAKYTDWQRQVGIIVHRLLKVICLQGVHSWQDQKLNQYHQNWQLILLQSGIATEEIAKSIHFIETAILNCLNDPRGQWILDNSHEDSQCEYALTTIIHQEIKQIIIDRTFVDKTGIRWIIDYKTSFESENNKETQLLEKHRAQLEQYALTMIQKESRSIHLGLYLPLTQQWVAWEYEKNQQDSPLKITV